MRDRANDVLTSDVKTSDFLESTGPGRFEITRLGTLARAKDVQSCAPFSNKRPIAAAAATAVTGRRACSTCVSLAPCPSRTPAKKGPTAEPSRLAATQAPGPVPGVSTAKYAGASPYNIS